MRFRRLKIVTTIIILIVLSACICTALVRKFIIPPEPGKHHGGLNVPRTKIAIPSPINVNQEYHPAGLIS